MTSMMIRVCLVLMLIVGSTMGKSLRDSLHESKKLLESIELELENSSNEFIKYQQQAGALLVQGQESIEVTKGQVYSEGMEMKKKAENDGKNVTSCFEEFDQKLQMILDESNENMESLVMEFVGTTPMKLFEVMNKIEGATDISTRLMEQFNACEGDETCIEALKEGIEGLESEVNGLKGDVKLVAEFVDNAGIEVIDRLNEVRQAAEGKMKDYLNVDIVECINKLNMQ